jgi:hypothetical protein
MNVLDENIVFEQREILRRWRLPFRQIGYELSRKGVKDPQIIPLLLQFKQATRRAPEIAPARKRSV